MLNRQATPVLSRYALKFGTSGLGQPTREPTGSPPSLAGCGDTTRQQCPASSTATLARWEVAEVVLRLRPGTMYRA